jgi:hypothetical protein
LEKFRVLNIEAVINDGICETIDALAGNLLEEEEKGLHFNIT